MKPLRCVRSQSSETLESSYLPLIERMFTTVLPKHFCSWYHVNNLFSLFRSILYHWSSQIPQNNSLSLPSPCIEWPDNIHPHTTLGSMETQRALWKLIHKSHPSPYHPRTNGNAVYAVKVNSQFTPLHPHTTLGSMETQRALWKLVHKLPLSSHQLCPDMCGSGPILEATSSPTIRQSVLEALHPVPSPINASESYHNFMTKWSNQEPFATKGLHTLKCAPIIQV